MVNILLSETRLKFSFHCIRSRYFNDKVNENECNGTAEQNKHHSISYCPGAAIIKLSLS